MNYLTLGGTVIGLWVLNMVITYFFNVHTKGKAEEHGKALIEHGRNIFAYGLFGVIVILIRNNFNNKITFFLMIAVMLVFGILLLIDVLRLVTTLLATTGLMFSKDYKGLDNSGKLSDWLFFLSMIVESSVIAFLLYNMYKSIL